MPLTQPSPSGRGEKAATPCKIVPFPRRERDRVRGVRRSGRALESAGAAVLFEIHVFEPLTRAAQRPERVLTGCGARLTEACAVPPTRVSRRAIAVAGKRRRGLRCGGLGGFLPR